MGNKSEKSIEKVREIQQEFTACKKLVQMHHPHTTQLNESINMRIVEVAPKHTKILALEALATESPMSSVSTMVARTPSLIVSFASSELRQQVFSATGRNGKIAGVRLKN